MVRHEAGVPRPASGNEGGMSKTIKIRVEHPTLDACPECGHEQYIANAFGKTDCRECGYHCGGDLGEAWLELCTTLVGSIPKGIEAGETHQSDSVGDDNWIAASGDLPAIEAWIERTPALLNIIVDDPDYGPSRLR